MKSTKALALMFCVVALSVTRPSITGAATTWQVVVSGLDNPEVSHSVSSVIS